MCTKKYPPPLLIFCLHLLTAKYSFPGMQLEVHFHLSGFSSVQTKIMPLQFFDMLLLCWKDQKWSPLLQGWKHCSESRTVTTVNSVRFTRKHRLLLFFTLPLPPPSLSLLLSQTHLRQPTSDAQVTQPVDGVHHTTPASSSSSALSRVQVRSQYTHTATVTLHLAGVPAARVSPQPPLCSWVCSPGALLRRLGGLQCVVDHLGGDSCPNRGCCDFSVEVCPGDSPAEVALDDNIVSHLAG